MEILSPTKFDTGMFRTVERVPSQEGSVRFRVEDTVNLSVVYIALDSDGNAALQTLLAGGELETPVTFKKGDIVRFFPNRNTVAWSAYVAQSGSLAVVTQDYDGSEAYVGVRWICARSEAQGDGEYQPGHFDVVTMDQLSDTDKQEIINHSLRG